MTKELIPHNVTIFPCIKEVTLRYWNQHCATRGFPFYLGEIKGSRGLPTNNHLALSPRVIWPCLMKAKLSFYNTEPHQLFPSPHKNSSKYANICKHLKNLPQSRCAVSKADWLESRSKAPSLLHVHLWLSFPLPACLCTQRQEQEKFWKSCFRSGQLVLSIVFIYIYIYLSDLSQWFGSIIFSCTQCHFTLYPHLPLHACIHTHAAIKHNNFLLQYLIWHV